MIYSGSHKRCTLDEGRGGAASPTTAPGINKKTLLQWWVPFEVEDELWRVDSLSNVLVDGVLEF